MKRFKLIAAVALATLTFSSCSDDDDSTVTTNLSAEAVNYDTDGAWADCYSSGDFTVSGLGFSHSWTMTEWDGVKYYSWKGFCPSRSSDNADHTDGGDWITYQWGSVTGGGLSGKGTPFVLGCWDVMESTEAIPENPTCSIKAVEGSKFSPKSIYVTNSNYGYWAMKNGTAFSRPFTATDRCVLIIHGVKDSRITGTVNVDLAADGVILDSWRKIDLKPLGEVNYIYFQMTSTDSGQWGMNSPAYFCLDRMEFTR